MSFILFSFFVRSNANTPSPKTAVVEGKNLCDIIDECCEVAHPSINTFSNLKKEVYSELLSPLKIAGVQVGQVFDRMNLTIIYHFCGSDQYYTAE